ncbi:hypothetical protein CP10743SC13_1547 [Chlamydia psittaci 10_743_SC13]|nr:hypothetical protein CP10743SC13_1547 [Chlamydia psittaci 10_743_SC13]
MHFLFANPPCKRKLLVFFSEISRLIEYQVFYLRESPFKQISRVFSSEIPHLSENHEFSPQKSPI